MNLLRTGGRLALLCSVLTSNRSAAAQDDSEFTDHERAQLAAGEIVTRRLVKQHNGVDMIGGSSWQVIDTAPEVVWRALQDTSHYPNMLPRVTEARVVAQQGHERIVYMLHKVWPLRVSYYVILRSHPQTRDLEFEVDDGRPHDLRSGWGFVRVIGRSDGKTLLAFGILAELGHGIVATVARPLIQFWMLRVPATVKKFLESGGRNYYLKTKQP